MAHVSARDRIVPAPVRVRDLALDPRRRKFAPRTAAPRCIHARARLRLDSPARRTALTAEIADRLCCASELIAGDDFSAVPAGHLLAWIVCVPGSEHRNCSALNA